MIQPDQATLDHHPDQSLNAVGTNPLVQEPGQRCLLHHPTMRRYHMHRFIGRFGVSCHGDRCEYLRDVGLDFYHPPHRAHEVFLSQHEGIAMVHSGNHREAIEVLFTPSIVMMQLWVVWLWWCVLIPFAPYIDQMTVILSDDELAGEGVDYLKVVD